MILSTPIYSGEPKNTTQFLAELYKTFSLEPPLGKGFDGKILYNFSHRKSEIDNTLYIDIKKAGESGKKYLCDLEEFLIKEKFKCIGSLK